MIVTFDKQYLRDLYDKGVSTDRKHWYQPDVVRKYVARIKLLEKAARIEDLFVFKSLNFENLSGDKKGISSIRVDNKYRIEFVVIDAGDVSLVTVCNILDLSNHYN